MRVRIHSLAFLVVVIALAASCKGEIGVTTGPGSQNSNNGNNGATTNNGVAPDLFPDVECTGIACEDPVPSSSARIVRLTHRQWENAVRDLFFLDEVSGLSQNFLGDTLSTGNFDRQADNLRISTGLWEDYREAAESIASDVASDGARLEMLLPPDAPADIDGRSRAFVTELGARVYRRPLTEDEVTAMLRVMAQAPEAFGTAPSFEKAAELAIRAFLQSPHFLHRVETSDAPTELVALTGHERASRLSFALWNTIPDTTLLAAADAGDLDTYEGVEAHARRMLEDPRAADVIEDFHAQLFGFSHFKEMQKAAELFPSFTEATSGLMEREMNLYIDDVVLGSNGTYRDLMTSNHSFVNPELAAIYGVEPPAQEFGRVTLDEATRRGVLTRAGFLALNATPYDPNPIHRGVFINRRVLCNQVPAPPDNFTIDENVMGNTNRERIDNATRTCGGGCHVNLINPPGFAFENYDALGAWRAMDGDYPVDPSGELGFDNGVQTWQTPDQLVELIADSPQAHACYVSNWFEYLHGRLPKDGDQPLIARLGEVSHSGDATIKEVLVALVASAPFLMRAKDGGEE